MGFFRFFGICSRPVERRNVSRRAYQTKIEPVESISPCSPHSPVTSPCATFGKANLHSCHWREIGVVGCWFKVQGLVGGLGKSAGDHITKDNPTGTTSIQTSPNVCTYKYRFSLNLRRSISSYPSSTVFQLDDSEKREILFYVPRLTKAEQSSKEQITGWTFNPESFSV